MITQIVSREVCSIFFRTLSPINRVKMKEKGPFFLPKAHSGTPGLEVSYFMCSLKGGQLSCGLVTTEGTSWKAGCGDMEVARSFPSEKSKNQQ